MKISQNGKVVKGATVAYDVNGGAQYVTVDGVNYDPKAFDIEDEDTSKKTKPASTKTKKTTDAPKKKRGLRNILSSKDV